jgi:hypothetical protein
MKLTFTNNLCAAAILIGMMMGPAIAKGSAIDTFSFTESGYTGGGTLTGSFTGTVEANGYIELGDLSAFNATFTVPTSVGEATGLFYLTDLQLFSVLPASDGPNSSLDFYAQTPGLAQNVCVGAAAAFGLCGAGGNFAGIGNTIGVGDASTPNFPILQLVSSVPSNPPAIAPEPVTYSFCGLTLIAAGLWRRRVKCMRPHECGHQRCQP